MTIAIPSHIYADCRHLRLDTSVAGSRITATSFFQVVLQGWQAASVLVRLAIRLARFSSMASILARGTVGDSKRTALRNEMVFSFVA